MLINEYFKNWIESDSLIAICLKQSNYDLEMSLIWCLIQFLKHRFVHNSAGGYTVDPIEGNVGKVTVKSLADQQILDKATKFKDNHYKDSRSSQKWCDCDHNKETTSEPKNDYDQNHSGSTHISADDSGVTYTYHHDYNYNCMYNDPIPHTNNYYVAPNIDDVATNLLAMLLQKVKQLEIIICLRMLSG